MPTTLAILAALLASLPTAAVAADSGNLIQRLSGGGVEDSIEGLLVGFGQASVSASSLARVGGDAVTAVENVRDFAVALQGDTPLSKKVFAVSITPARSTLGFPRLSLVDYAGNSRPGGGRENKLGNRLLGSLTFAYAQGESRASGASFQRRAVSVETSAYFRPADDPVVAMADEACVTKALDAATPRPPAPTPSGPVLVRRVEVKSAAEAYQNCVDIALARLDKQWNRPRFSVSMGTGWIQRSDGSGSQSRLGQTLAAGLVWGFQGLPMPENMKDNSALSLLVRHSRDEPVLSTLSAGPVALRTSTLAALRLTTGSSTFRGLLELSNAGSGDVTTSQASFKRALGIDYRVTEGVWLNLRTGRQRKIEGGGSEVGSFLSLSYSPKPRLGLGL